MADIQKQFEEFHDNIRLGDKDGKAKLREKRQLLIDNLTEGLAKLEDNYTFKHFNQGSYAMHTGIKPQNDEYDIDVGIIFDNEQEDFDNPVALKKMVKTALESNFRTVKIRRPCVTVTYHKDGKPEYHVDLAIYVKKPYTDYYDLAMGREHSTEDHTEWLNSDPKGLIAKINERFSDDDRKQFKRIIRYLKCWRNHKFSNSNEAPISIGLTCAAYHWFSPYKIAGKYSDLQALHNLTEIMLDKFGFFSDRLEVTLPVIPENDLLEGMTDKQMEVFKEKLTGLRDASKKAISKSSSSEACKLLVKQFGSQFSTVESEKNHLSHSIQSAVPPVVVTGSSA